MTLRQRIISVTDANINNKSLKFPNTSLHNRVQLWPTEYVACYFKTHYNTNSHHQSEWIKESILFKFHHLFSAFYECASKIFSDEGTGNNCYLLYM